MVIWIVVIGSVAVVLAAALVAAGISTRTTTPCLFDHSTVHTREGRFDGGICSGKPDNVYVAYYGPTMHLTGTRVCNGHVKHLQNVVDQLTRES